MILIDIGNTILQFKRKEPSTGIRENAGLLSFVTLYSCRYAVYVMALGHVFHLMWGTQEIDEWIFGLMGALGLELVVWEMIGNSDFVQNKIRDGESDTMGNTLGKL